ncbi:hypothetical protein Pmani_006068 [Petrolisthes manimaculis]|uniref:Gamma-tubulin complex component 6 n=1 Tax=Petrolisthes manimaculis TaxID=1843537 RepID=A0AAE1QDQ5_9EUCA|nr:hypothetical protein Pmani_006068 [Petrolisthes manimaculis]
MHLPPPRIELSQPEEKNSLCSAPLHTSSPHHNVLASSTNNPSSWCCLGTESTVGLVNQLVEHVSQDWVQGVWGCTRDKREEEAHRKALKVLVYSVLLSHRKDYEQENSALRLTEVEEVMWQGFVLRQQRRHDDANTLDRCLTRLKELGHLKLGSDVRSAMKFLVALKGQGEVEQKFTLAKITPRILQSEKEPDNFLPPGPLDYGDTFLQSAEYRSHYMHFPPSLFSLSQMETGVGEIKRGGQSTAYPFEIENMLALSKATPGTGVNPLLLGSEGSVHSGKVMGALMRETREVTPDTVLSIPELPSLAKGYVRLNLHPTNFPQASSPSAHSAVASDEGYASSRSGRPYSPEVEDVWEEVMGGPPLSSRRTWETLGQIPSTIEKPFLSESGMEASHNVWVVYQDLWGSLGGKRPPSLYVRSSKEICQDLLNLMIGIPSRSFLWDEESEEFSVAGSLCHPGITPEHLKSSLLPFIQCGSLVHRLEELCSSPQYNSQEVVTQGVVFQAFTLAISNFLQAYRGWVFSLGGEEHLARLQQRAQPLLRKVKFVAHLCKFTEVNSTKQPRGNEENQGEDRLRGKQDIPRGLTLLGELLNQIMVTKDREYLLILVSIFKNSCIPFFRYLEAWIYRGVCHDPGQEFMVKVDGEALLRRDREYWTRGYTLQSHATSITSSSNSHFAALPPLLREVLKEAFTCGKAVNLLRVCSNKHHLVECGQWEHPQLELCESQTGVEQMKSHCQVYAARMDHLAALHQVTVQQKAEQDLKEKHQLMLISSKKRMDTLREFEKKMLDAMELEDVRKRLQFKELKEEMLKAEQRKKEEKVKDAEEDKIIAQELEKKEAKKDDEEKTLRAKIEDFYRQKLKIAERREALSHWRVQRCQLRDRRKWFISHSSWGNFQEESSHPVDTDKEPTNIEENVKCEEAKGKSSTKGDEELNRNDMVELKEGKENKLDHESATLSVPEEEKKYEKKGEEAISPVEVRDDALPSPASDFLHSRKEFSHSAFSMHSHNTHPGTSMLKDYSPSEYLLVSYPGQTAEPKESPNQEVSSVSEMTASLMSTSSDFVDTPYDENLPDFDVDPRRPSSSDAYVEDKISPAYTKSSIEFILYDRSEDIYFTRHRDQTTEHTASLPRTEASVNKSRVLEEEYGIQSQTTEGGEGRVMRASEENLNVSRKSVTEAIREKVLREEYGITINRKTVQAEQDSNANYAGVDVPDTLDPGSNGNGNPGDRINSNGNNGNATNRDNGNGNMRSDFNANVQSETSPTISEPTINLTNPSISDPKDQNTNIDTMTTNLTSNTKTENTKKNSNSTTPNMNELVFQFKERRAQAAATREKVMNEDFQITNNKNMMNISWSRSRPTLSSAAAKNKQKILESEYGLSEAERYKKEVYGRQMSWGSTASSSYRSGSTSTSERPTSSCTVFTTPDEEEMPVLIDQELLSSGTSPTSNESASTAATPDDALLSASTNSALSPAVPYMTDHLLLMGKEPLMDITGTALNGQPHTRESHQEDESSSPSTHDLTCIPIYFIQSIRAHLAIQSRLVHQHLLSEVLVQESLLQHFSALRSLLLMHDAHFARALTVNLFNKMEGPQHPSSLLVPVELNNVLSRALSESCWNTSPLADNLSFAVLSIPRAFTKPGKVLECLELRYHVGWPHTLILDDSSLKAYSQVWVFLARLHHAVWASDTLFSHISSLGREDKDGTLSRSPQFHQICLFRHQIHCFLLVIQDYVINQVHQISWIQFERKLQGKISTLDQLYELHSSLITSILTQCFLTRKGDVMQKLIQDVFSLSLHFFSLVVSRPWQLDTNTWHHPAFPAIKSSHMEFQKLAAFLHKLLMKVGDRVRMEPSHQDLLNRLDFITYYSR